MAVLFYSKKMVKKGYCGNENLALARDRIKVCEIAPFTLLRLINNLNFIKELM